MTKRSEGWGLRTAIHPETGETWYILADVCRKLGARSGYWRNKLPETMQLHLPGEDYEAWHRERAWSGATVISPAALLEVLLSSTRAESVKLGRDILKQAAANKTLVAVAVTGIEALPDDVAPKNGHVLVEDVQRWLKMRETGLSLGEIAKKEGRTRAVVWTYTNPEKAPLFVKRALWPDG